jgi:hypothetical protein
MPSRVRLSLMFGNQYATLEPESTTLSRMSPKGAFVVKGALVALQLTKVLRIRRDVAP